MKSVLLAVVLVALAQIGYAQIGHAQSLALPPTYGSISLNAGFPLDPYFVRVSPGGPIDARQTLGGNCRGLIANAPDLQLNYRAGNVFPLYIFVLSGIDTTLIVNDPSGTWRCDDDSLGGLNPLIAYPDPQSGFYTIWVGALLPEISPVQATLFITELQP